MKIRTEQERTITFDKMEAGDILLFVRKNNEVDATYIKELNGIEDGIIRYNQNCIVGIEDYQNWIVNKTIYLLKLQPNGDRITYEVIS